MPSTAPGTNFGVTLSVYYPHVSGDSENRSCNVADQPVKKTASTRWRHHVALRDDDSLVAPKKHDAIMDIEAYTYTCDKRPDLLPGRERPSGK